MLKNIISSENLFKMVMITIFSLFILLYTIYLIDSSTKIQFLSAIIPQLEQGFVFILITRQASRLESCRVYTRTLFEAPFRNWGIARIQDLETF